MRKLLKFAYNPADPRVVVRYLHEERAQRPEVVTLESGDRPLPELSQALTRMDRWLRDLGDLPDDWDLTVRGFSRSSSGGLVITGLRAMDDSPSPMVINTPHVAEVDGPLAEDLAAIEALVLRYVDGEREQLQLAFEDEEPDLGQA